MNEVEEFYLQHYGVKGMKWGVRKKRNPAQKAQRKAEKKAQKGLYKEAKGDIHSWARAKNAHSKDLVNAANKDIDRKRANNKGYDQAYEKARKSYNRTARAVQIGAIAYTGLAVASITHPEAVQKGASVVGAVLGNAASTTGMYAKYAAKAAVPVSRTIKNRGVINAVVANGSNLARYAG